MTSRVIFLNIAGVLLCWGFALPGMAQDVGLYPTSPSEDAAFVRFVNGGGDKLDIIASDSKVMVTLDENTSSTKFFPIQAHHEISGTLTSGLHKEHVVLEAEPGEFITVVGINESGNDLSLKILRESPEDFNAARASVAFFNQNPRCAKAGLQVAGRTVFVFEDVAPDAMARRQINPVPLSVQLMCNDQPLGQPLDLGSLEGGERYSIFLTSELSDERLFYVIDSVAY